ncbi:MAG: NAD-dependent epimerase/dehydratase family protein [Anaerolineae bacterium]|nr:NAD-dependent epimerase/dehydratase family protein [Anaerolineae bacterium]
MKVLVTGATGFIGGHLAQTLLAQGHHVRLLVRPASIPPPCLGFEICWGDVSDSETTRTAVKGIDLVYHLAAIRDRWGIPYRDYYRVNVEGTRHLLQSAADQGSRFVYCSSVGVMGHPGCLDIDEGFPYAAGDGKYNYSHTKALADEMVLDYGAKKRLFATVVRPVITYGPGDTWGMVTRLIDLLARGRFLPVGNGRNYLHLAYIADVVQGFLLAAENDRANGQVYIIAGPAPITLNDLVDKMAQLLEMPVPSWHVPAYLARIVGRGLETFYALKQYMGIETLGSVPFITRDKVDTLVINRSYSILKAQKELGFKPIVGYDEGLSKTIAWWRGPQSERAQRYASGPALA